MGRFIVWDDVEAHVEQPLCELLNQFLTNGYNDGSGQVEEGEIGELLDEHIVHFQGYAYGLQKQDHDRICEELRRLLGTFETKVLVWDGDSHEEGSFTQFIPIIAQDHRDSIKFLVTYCMESHLDRVERSWRPIMNELPQDLIVFRTRELPDYVELSVHAFSHTKGARAITIGGGQCVKETKERVPGVLYHHIEVERVSRNE